jgi:hypothetical protein
VHAAAESTSAAAVVIEPGAVAAAAAELAAAAPAAGDARSEKQDERTRIGAIVSSPEAKGREGLAQHLAFNTELPAAEAVAMLKTAPVAAAERVSRLDGNVPAPHVDAVEHDASGDRSAGLAAAMVRQLAKIHKEPRKPL